jgi:integrase
VTPEAAVSPSPRTRAHRPSGKGHVFRRGRLWWISLYVDGQRHRESSGSTLRTDAVRLLAERVALLAPAPGLASTRLSDLCGIITTHYEINRRRSAARLRVCLGHLRDHFRDPLARSIDASALFGYVEARLQQGAGPGTINVELAVLRRAFRLALKLGRIAKVPEFQLLTPPPPRQGFVEREQLERVLAELPQALRPAVAVGAITGWRFRSELLTREWRHVDLAGGWLRLEPGEGKTGEGREFPLTAELRTILEAQQRAADALARRWGPKRRPRTVFFHADGKPIRSYRAAWRAACAAAGVAGLRPHDLRRTAVRNLERDGVARATAMKMVGHKTEAIYRRYAIQDATMLREAAKKIDSKRRRSRG